MCIIIDANVASEIPALTDDARPVMSAVFDRGLKIVSGQKVKRELLGCKFRLLYRELLLAGRLIEFDDDRIQREEEGLDPDLLVSDDPHVIALARVSGARILFSRDVDLHSDFKNHRIISGPRGSVYQNRAHKDLLLEKDACGCH
jgi:hypothetical protein